MVSFDVGDDGDDGGVVVGVMMVHAVALIEWVILVLMLVVALLVLLLVALMMARSLLTSLLLLVLRLFAPTIQMMLHVPMMD